MTIPVVLPVVRVTVDESGSLTLALDGQPYASQGRLARSDLRRLLTALTRESQGPVRVEVTEADGTTYTDIAAPADEAVNAEPHGQHQINAETRPHITPSMPGLDGAGFKPGEQVAVAFVLRRQTADENGITSLRLPPAMLATHKASLILVGLDSKVMTPLDATPPTVTRARA
jgi:hypothetical protein